MLVDDAQLAVLSGLRFGRLLQLAETGSTNAVALGMARKGEPEGLVVVADYQSAGRGRLDRRWEAPPGRCLLVSVLMRPPAGELPPGRAHLAVAALSLAVADAAREVAGVALELKWPNDLVHGPDKVAGVLAETGPEGALVVGVGANVTWAPPGLPATSLAALAGAEVDRSALLVGALCWFDRLYGRWDLVAKRYRDECATVGRAVVAQRPGGQPDLVGTAVGVDEDGHLLVRSVDGTQVALAVGDVVHAMA